MRDQVSLPSKVRQVPEYFPSLGTGVPYGTQFDEFGGEVQLREYWRILWKYRLYVAVIIVSSIILSAVYAFTVTPLYKAQSKIRIATYEPTLGSTKVEDILEEKSKESTYLETQIQELKSYSLADRVLEDETIRNTLTKPGGTRGLLSIIMGGRPSTTDTEPSLDTSSGYKVPYKLLERYLGMIDIQPIRRTSLVVISATSPDPRLSQDIANRHAVAYIDWVRTVRIDQQSRGLKFLRGQADELREKVADLERELADYAEANSIVAVNKDENVTAQKMSQLNKLLTDSTAKRIELENNYREAEAALTGNGAGFEDGTTAAMRTQLAQLEAEYQQLGAKFTPSYPKMQQLASQIAGVKAGIKRQREQIVVGMKSKAIAAAEEEKHLKEELDQQTSQAFELSKRQVQYNILNRELTTSRDLLQSVLKQIKETSLAVESNATNVSVVDSAVAPRAPSFPRKKLMVLFGLGIGIFLAALTVFILNYLDNSVRTPEDVSDMLKLPCLGVVPSFDLRLSDGTGVASNVSLREKEEKSERAGDQQSGGSMVKTEDEFNFPVVYLKDPKSLASEAYRTIRTGILLSQAGEPPRTILVTSAQSSEGKTTSSLNLAASLASAGGRVVLIDADLRRPSVSKYFGLEQNLPGLVELITGQLELKDVGRMDLIRRVTIIPSGTIPPNPAELLGSLEMATILDQLAAQYDYIIIDSPPILPVTDSVILSRYVDGVIMVVKGAATPRKVIRDARDRLSSVGARLLGVVLNDVDITGGDYYYYNRYYHSYYRETQTPQKAAI